jgi:hypothetical protein
MGRAESLPGIDFDGEAAARLGAIMAAMDEKAPRSHRMQSALHQSHPIFLRQFRDLQV